jgi:hypothetical protein
MANEPGMPARNLAIIPGDIVFRITAKGNDLFGNWKAFTGERAGMNNDLQLPFWLMGKIRSRGRGPIVSHKR